MDNTTPCQLLQYQTGQYKPAYIIKCDSCKKSDKNSKIIRGSDGNLCIKCINKLSVAVYVCIKCGYYVKQIECLICFKCNERICPQCAGKFIGMEMAHCKSCFDYKCATCYSGLDKHKIYNNKNCYCKRCIQKYV